MGIGPTQQVSEKQFMIGEEREEEKKVLFNVIVRTTDRLVSPRSRPNDEKCNMSMGALPMKQERNHGRDRDIDGVRLSSLTPRSVSVGH